MNSESFFVAAPETTSHAYPVLDDLMARVGVDGLAEALAHPALLAAVDQHAAAVRESLRTAGRPVDAGSVSAYARSVMAAVERMGRRLPEPGEADLGAGWLRAEWHLLRLLGVCALAEEADWL
jgi:uncharacterized protein DUF6401